MHAANHDLMLSEEIKGFERLNIADFAVSIDDLIKVFEPYIDFLSPDLYAKKSAFFRLLEAYSPTLFNHLLSDLLKYYKGDIDFSEISFDFGGLPDELMSILECEPHRMRGVINIQAEKAGHGWLLTPSVENSVSQNVNKNDVRSIPRDYFNFPDEILKNHALIEFISFILNKSNAMLTKTGSMQRDKFKVSLFLDKNRPTRYAELNSFIHEGIHKDGCLMLVPAFVIERSNMNGGESVLYNNKGSELDRTTLKPGEGTLLCDQEMFFHKVTPQSSILDSENSCRTFIGLDIHDCTAT